MASRDELGVEMILRGDAASHIRVTGEIDFDSAAMLRARLLPLLTEPQPRLVLDVSGVTFCDSTGLGALISLRAAALAGGGSLVLVGTTGQLARLLRTTCLETLFAAGDARAPGGHTARTDATHGGHASAGS